MNPVQPMERHAAPLKRSYDRHRPLVLWPLVGLQPILLAVGVLMAAIPLLSSMRDYCRTAQRGEQR